MTNPSNQMPRFDQSNGNINNMFENSQISGQNAATSQAVTTLTHCQSQRLMKSGTAAPGDHGSLKKPSPYSRLPHVPKKGAKTRTEDAVDKELGSSRVSAQSNEMVVVEEVNDNEISNEAFMKMRQQSPLVKSLIAASRTDAIVIGPLSEENRFQYAGSVVDESQKQSIRASDLPPSSLSSIHQDQNTTFFSNSKTMLRQQSNLEQSSQQPGPTQKRVVQKSLISDLNQAHNPLQLSAAMPKPGSVLSQKNLSRPEYMARPTLAETQRPSQSSYKIPKHLSRHAPSSSSPNKMVSTTSSHYQRTLKQFARTYGSRHNYYKKNVP